MTLYELPSNLVANLRKIYLPFGIKNAVFYYSNMRSSFGSEERRGRQRYRRKARRKEGHAARGKEKRGN